jgi:acyl-CoA synthetase (AMP-forming)/AMP-acid ligase II
MARFVFLAPNGGETTLDPHSPAASARIRAIAAHLRESMPPGGAVGLLYRSEPNLIIAWFAALVAGLRPLVMQYPTQKQSRAYWIDSVRNTVATAGLAGIVADDYCTSLDLAEFPNSVAQAELDGLPDAMPGPVLPDDFTIIQLSSGTTGYRKAMEFSSAALARHVADYNEVLGLTPGEDRIASWLPLYHDMGYIACFVMPILLGIDVVMMDPMDWVKQPEMLVTAIERHQATTCYMPNFGYEVMARVGMPPLPSMQRWICTAEPISVKTAEKFLNASGAPAETFLPLYGMAENMFAVSAAAGCRTIEIDGVDLVSCGAPIPGVEIKIVEGEIWLRSPTSLARYMGGDDIRDAEGFYPTGDRGLVIDGEIYVSGRKQDLLIQAGKKFFLSDVDLRLNELRPEVRGRAATLAVHDERLGTEMPIVLIEAPDFFERNDASQIASDLKDATGLDQIEVAFVPPRFLTKTSSGKFNRRKSRADWIAARESRNGTGAADRDPVTEIRASFPGVAWDEPVAEVLDSLSLIVLRIILDASTVRFQRQQSLTEIVAALEATRGRPAEARSEEGIRIVAVSDRTTVGGITTAHLHRLGQSFGCEVTLEHVCLPPSPVVFSDMVFHDYFQPRLDQEEFAAVSRAMSKLKQASVIVTDDLTEMFFLYESTYPALSHNLERDPRADLISYRWPGYTRNHHRLPLTVVSGLDLSLGASNTVLDQMSRYLGIPIFRTARTPGFAEFTREWEFQAVDQPWHGVDPDLLVESLLRWAHEQAVPLARRALPAGERISSSDPPHFCSISVSREAIDRVVERYDRFCIAGPASSLPYLRRELDRQGKSYVHVPSYAKQILSGLDFEYDCLVICGAMGELPTEFDKPIIALQHIGLEQRTWNVGEFAGEIAGLEEHVQSGVDWLHLFELERAKDLEQWRATRVETQQALQRLVQQAADSAG